MNQPNMQPQSGLGKYSPIQNAITPASVDADPSERKVARADALNLVEDAQMLREMPWDYGASVLETEDGKTRLAIGHGYDLDVLGMERFLNAVEGSDALPFERKVSRGGRAYMEAKRLARFIHAVCSFTPEALTIFQPSERAREAIRCYRRLHLNQEDVRRPGDIAITTRSSAELMVGDLLNCFVQLLRRRLASKAVRRRIAARKERARKNHAAAGRMVDRLRSRYSKLLVLRLDVGYKRLRFPLSGEWEPSDALDENSAKGAKKALKKFFNNARTNMLFKYMVGYIWKLEIGEATGHHFHLVLFFDGNKVKQDDYLCQQIGEYWAQEITKGEGRFHNCNRDKNEYRQCAIGMLHHDDDTAYDRLLNIAIAYLTKKEEFLRPVVPKGYRVFDHSCVKPKPTNAGRPRAKKARPTSSTKESVESD